MDNEYFLEMRAKKAGIITPLALLDNVKEQVKDKKVDRIIVLGLTPDGEPYAGWSGGMKEYEIRGAIDICKEELLAMIKEDEEDY